MRGEIKTVPTPEPHVPLAGTINAPHHGETVNSEAAMPFINQTVTDADIDQYGLPFEKGRPRYWTYDREAKRYLWGGIAGNPAFDDIREGRFWLFTTNRLFYIVIEPGEISKTYKDSPYKLEWRKILNISPSPESEELRNTIIADLKEALLVYGVDGRTNKFTPLRNILFLF
jgi:hypothetical protein